MHDLYYIMISATFYFMMVSIFSILLCGLELLLSNMYDKEWYAIVQKQYKRIMKFSLGLFLITSLIFLLHKLQMFSELFNF